MSAGAAAGTSVAQRGDMLERLIPLARAAGDVILDVYASDFAVRGKADASPVTEADERAEAVILAGLAALTPDIPVVSEEAASSGSIPAVDQTFWLVDPLDGTKEFISRNGEFTVNIALIEHGVPVLGVVLAPTLGRLHAGAEGLGAFTEGATGNRTASRVRPVPADGLVVVSSRSHGDADALDRFLAGRKVASSLSAGSSLKFCLIATGAADVYPRLGRTMQWDTAAGHAVLRAAGGRVTDLQGKELVYGKPGFENPHFVASGSGFAAEAAPTNAVGFAAAAAPTSEPHRPAMIPVGAAAAANPISQVATTAEKSPPE